MKGTLEDVPDESLEKWPPAWADYDWAGGYDQDDFDDYVRNRWHNKRSLTSKS